MLNVCFREHPEHGTGPRQTAHDAVAMNEPSLAPGRRVVCERFGEDPTDAVAHHLSLVEQPPPDPSALGRDEAIVRVRAAAVGWVDLLMTSGQYQHMANPPYTPGLEYAGDVVALGAEGQGGLSRGDAVLVDGFSAGPRSLGNYQSAGGFATYAVVPTSALHRLPGKLGYAEAAALLGSYETAYHCLVTRGRVGPGDAVLILGASGATGLAAVQVAKLLGATVIAAGRSDHKLAAVARAGADHVINVRTSADDPTIRPFRDDVKALTGGKGVSVVYDAVGGDISLEALRAVQFGARFLIVGWASTPLVARGKGGRGAPNANVLPTNLIMMKSLDVLGCPTAISTAENPASRAPRLRQILAWAEQGAIAPVVSHRFSIDQFREALETKWRGEVTGGAVIEM
jgi:NADPH2:quinone reductase